jgi:TolB-like protein
MRKRFLFSFPSFVKGVGTPTAVGTPAAIGTPTATGTPAAGIVGVCLIVLLAMVPRVGAHEEIDALYRQGDYPSIIAQFSGKASLKAQEVLYLGLSYLQKGRMADGIDLWQKYVATHKGSEMRRRIAGYLTLLNQSVARQVARDAIRTEKNLSAVGSEAVVVMPFRNLGSAEYDPLSVGLAQMIITDLSHVPSLKVVERLKIAAVVSEIQLGGSGLVDPDTVVRSGKLLGAGQMVIGSFSSLEGDRLQIDGGLLKTETGEVLTFPSAVENLSDFYLLEKVLVKKILCELGQCPETLDRSTQEKLEKTHTKSLNAFLSYSHGVQALDAGQYREAGKFFFDAILQDPEFDLARDALIETPLFAIDLQTTLVPKEEGQGEEVGWGQAK